MLAPPSLRFDRLLLRDSAHMLPLPRLRRCFRFFRKPQSLMSYLPLAIFAAVALATVIAYRILFVPPVKGFIPREPFDVFIISAYYYAKSTSLGDNSVALVFTGDFQMVKDHKTITVLAWNSTDNAMATVNMENITPHEVCRWVAIFATAQLLPNMEKLAISMGNRYTEIPFVTPAPSKHDVITCISPLFANEQWQYLLLAAHTYKRFGSHMHLYIRSMVTPVFQLMQIYEKEGYMTIQPWLRVHLNSIDEADFNPNINIEFRNQAAAQTDCLLQYKESAQFISFMDLDDIIFPRLGASYLEEFEYLFNLQPSIAFLHYAKFNVFVEGQRDPEDFSLNQMISSIKFNQQMETGKMVTRPGTFNNTWIHWPQVVPKGMIRYDVPPEINVITHLKFMEEDTHARSLSVDPPPFDPTGVVGGGRRNRLLTAEQVKELHSDMMRMQTLPSISLLYKSLPLTSFYFDLILKCFNDTFYQYHYSGRISQIKCPGPDRCNFPRNAGISCSNARSNYTSVVGGARMNVHYWTSARFETDPRGCIP